FALLDANKDGKLSRDEIAAAAKALAKLDADEDETVTASEVAPQLFPVLPPGAAVNPALPRPPQPDNRDFLVLGELPPAEVALVRGRGAGAGEGRPEARTLAGEAVALEPAVFAGLDRNGDGRLALGELEAFADRPADVELKVRLGERAKGAALLEVVRPAGKADLAASVRKTGDGSVVLQFGASRVELRCDRSRLAPRFFATLKQTYLREFKTADADGNGHVDRNEALRSPFFRGIFAALDRNADGRLEEKELLDFLDGVLAPHARALAYRGSLVLSPPG